MTPFKALYERDPPSLLRFTDEISAVEEVNQQLMARNNILYELKANLSHAQAQMKVYADAKPREVVVDCRTLLNGSKEVLIKWKDLLDFENTWESYEIIDAQFPHFHLEDKVKLVWGGGGYC
ncbi:hypothetical protein KY290_026014 [Solanum tuberosum]|uniref:Chromo domain-containing protein n=1 Tax=Solanum tuberosum TaxID=4113 RepID=A0ABQ7UV68_SOLTU|nr:hypothetical protein KY289_025099 [Solanum tuberosum]KAH0673805.1 hypothetical protein KY284_024892 [Solanum tuberosum]KAH0677090.1 hypothetical protein KY285_024891 [Solanum tuberosum]KAH0755744.1 hypothetical protein KY290_026014 [Solanum tuberosum]